MIDKVDLTLHFGNEDQDLWVVLKEFPREEWEGLLKKALRFWALERKRSEEQAREPTWSLEDLFYQSSQEPTSLDTIPLDTPRKDNFRDSILKQDSILEDPLVIEGKPTPLQHLFALMGEEDDEDVLNLLQGKKTTITSITKIQEQIEGIPLEKEPNPSNTSGSSELMQGNPPVNHTISGLNHILQNIIGEEDDPEVLKYFNPQKDGKP